MYSLVLYVNNYIYLLRVMLYDYQQTVQMVSFCRHVLHFWDKVFISCYIYLRVYWTLAIGLLNFVYLSIEPAKLNRYIECCWWLTQSTSIYHELFWTVCSFCLDWLVIDWGLCLIMSRRFFFVTYLSFITYSYQ